MLINFGYPIYTSKIDRRINRILERPAHPRIFCNVDPGYGAGAPSRESARP
eukprot:COSAG01_NODE_31105_length_603_cov_4.696429_1_plen_50_part_01